MIYCGTIVAVKGYEGSMVVSDLQRDVPALQAGMAVNIGYSEQFSREFKILEWRQSKLKSIIKLVNIETTESAKELKEMGIFANIDHLKELDKDYVPLDDIIDCEIFNIENGEKIGVILEVWDTPANKVWLISHDNREVAIPVIEQVVKSIDTENKRVEIQLIDGMLDI